MKLTKKQAIKFKNNPNINPITDLIFTERDGNMYQTILDAYCNFINWYLETKRRKPLIIRNESYYCDNFSEYNNIETSKNNTNDGFLDDCNSDTD